MLDTYFEIAKPLIAGALGFGAKWLLDYYYLRSPRIKATVKITNQSGSPQGRGYMECVFTANVEFHNHSKNDAYALTVEEIKTGEAIIITKVPTVERKSLTETGPLNAPFEFKIRVKQLESGGTLAHLMSVNPRFVLSVSYNNQFGRRYRKSITANVLNEPGFEFWVV